jgi:hypothetical protein
MAKRLTDKQRVALEAVEAAKAAGLGLNAYAQANGLNVRQIYDAMAALRRHGVLAPTRVRCARPSKCRSIANPPGQANQLRRLFKSRSIEAGRIENLIRSSLPDSHLAFT